MIRCLMCYYTIRKKETEEGMPLQRYLRRLFFWTMHGGEVNAKESEKRMCSIWLS